MSATGTMMRLAAWLDALMRGDGPTLLDSLAEDVVFMTPCKAETQVVPYLGTHVGKAQVANAFRIRGELGETIASEVLDFGAQGFRGWALVWSCERHRASGRMFEIHAAHHLWFGKKGKIQRWRSFFDPTAQVNAYRGAIV